MCTPPERSSALPPNTLRVTHWTPKNSGGSDLVPEADFQGRREPRMLTTDISLREGPIYREISLRFKEDHEAFTAAYRRAWFKLTQRDLGPKARYLGAEVPAEDLIWQDPVPARDYDRSTRRTSRRWKRRSRMRGDGLRARLDRLGGILDLPQ